MHSNPTITRQKLDQAVGLVELSGLDVWLTFVRETADGRDPVLPLILEGGLTWQSALLISGSGEKIAIVGNFDADPLIASGNWTKVVPYVQGVREPLLAELERLTTGVIVPRIGVNFSQDNVKADGLSHGMYLLLESFLRGSRFEGRLESAEDVCGALRAIKTQGEIDRMRGAIAQTDRMFEEIGKFAKVGVSERAIFDHVHKIADQRGLGFSWNLDGDPIVNSGPNSMIGHGIPSPDIQLQNGHVFHVDLGLLSEGYASDIQRCWYVGDQVPQDVNEAMHAVNAAISAAADLLKPGVQGWEVDAAARNCLTKAGYDEYMHATGHQVGRVAHDGGAILGPRWERYGNTPMTPIRQGEVYTIELGVILPQRGYLGIEEMVVVAADGVEWLTQRQITMPTI